MEEITARSFYLDQMPITHKVSYNNKCYAIAQYERGRNLSNGGFSEVYEVRQISSARSQKDVGRELVAKLMTVSDKLSESLFTNQITAFLKIKEQQIQDYFVKLYDCWKDQNYFYLIFQKCRKGSLYDLLSYSKKYEKKLKKQHILYFVHSVLKALQALHHSKIINRDVKLQNVLIDDNLNAKLVDFGVSFVSAQGSQPAQYRYGTPFYMAPQVLIQNPVYGQKVDIWSLGVLLYYTLFSKYPFTVETPKDTEIKRQELCNNLYKRIKNSQISFALDKNLANQEDYQQLIKLNRLMLQKDQKKRQSATSLLSLDIFKNFDFNYLEKLKSSLEEEYFDYFTHKICDTTKWKQKITFEQPQIHPQLAQKLKHPRKVHVIEALHMRKFGFFLLLSDKSLFAYFNNHNLLKYRPDQFYSQIKEYELQSQEYQQQNFERVNEMKILIYVRNKYFKELITQLEKKLINLQQQQGYEYFCHPDCGIHKLFYNNHTLFVRLSNQTLQVFFQKSSQQQKDKQQSFLSRSITLNNNQRQKGEIVYKNNQKVYTYQNFEQAAHQASVCKQYIQYVRQVFSTILDNSSISLQKYGYKRVIGNQKPSNN